MKAIKQCAAVLLTSALTFTLVSGCSGGKNNGSEASNPPAQETLKLVNGKYDPPVTITTIRGVNPDVTFKNGETIENNVHTRWAEERLGIKIKYNWTVTNTNDAFATKLRLALASDEEMPDIIAMREDSDILDALLDSGKFMEVGELFDKYASETWKNAMNEDPTVWYRYMRDGKKYGIPILDYAYNSDPVLWIREDWMKKLNLQAPKTIEDVEKIMDAFVNQDPDGNGQKDTWGLTLGTKNAFNTWMSDVSWLFGAYGAMPNQWNLNSEGNLEFGSVQPGVKEGLIKLKEWKEKGYIPTEFSLWDESKATEAFVSGKAGMIAGPHWMVAWPLGDLSKNVKGAEFKAYPLPTGPDGKGGRHATSVRNGVVLINKNMKHPEVFFTYQNYWFDNYAERKAGSEFEFGTFQGYDYDFVDGKWVDETKVPGGGAPAYKYTLTFDGARIPSLNMKTMSKLANGEPPTTPFEKILAEGTPKTMLDAAKIVMDQKDLAVPNMFQTRQTPTMKKRQEYLGKLEKDVFSKIIYGKVGPEQFDKFVEEWKSSGGDDMTKEVNEWYQSVK